MFVQLPEFLLSFSLFLSTSSCFLVCNNNDRRMIEMHVIRKIRWNKIYIYIYPVPKFRSCHKAIMVITGRAHCYTFCIFRSLLMQFEHSLGLGGESLLDVHYLHYALLTARSLSTLVTPQCNPHNV